LKQGANVTVDVPIGSKCHCGRFDLGRFVKAPKVLGERERSLLGEGFKILLSKD
jgi:hypothetical protein